MAGKLKVYEYSGCSTCKKALKFLDAKGVNYEKIPILETPPSVAELRAMLQHLGGEIRKLFNTSGQAYREMGMGEKLKGLGRPGQITPGQLTEEQALGLLAKNGRLVKRPFAIRSGAGGAAGLRGAVGFGAVGFNEAQWKQFVK